MSLTAGDKSEKDVRPGRYLCTWSGGKDSSLACYRALQEGYNISHLVNFISKQYKRVSFHGTEARMIKLQSQLLGIKLVQKETTPDGYEQEFKEAVRSVRSADLRGIIFGDVYLQEHKKWAERVCSELGIEAVEPLWGDDPEQLLCGFVDADFVAIIVSAQADVVDNDWVGRKVDRAFLEYLKANHIDLCGENGEYHTLVVDGPIFEKKIEITEQQIVKIENFWFLDTVAYRSVDKHEATTTIRSSTVRNLPVDGKIDPG